MAEEEQETRPSSERRRGRPRKPSLIARPNRLVTFVTDRELKYLTKVVAEEERSMASFIHRVIAAHIAENEKK